MLFGQILRQVWLMYTEIISWRQVRQCYQILNQILMIGQWLTIY